jgi:hypothetical protein
LSAEIARDPLWLACSCHCAIGYRMYLRVDSASSDRPTARRSRSVDETPATTTTIDLLSGVFQIAQTNKQINKLTNTNAPERQASARTRGLLVGRSHRLPSATTMQSTTTTTLTMTMMTVMHRSVASARSTSSRATTHRALCDLDRCGRWEDNANTQKKKKKKNSWRRGQSQRKFTFELQRQANVDAI